MRHALALSFIAILATACGDATAPRAGAHALIRGQVLRDGDVALASSDLSVSCSPEINWWIVTVTNTDAAGRFALTFRVTGEAADAVRRSSYLIECRFYAPATTTPALVDAAHRVRFGPDDQSAPVTDVLLRQNIPSN